MKNHPSSFFRSGALLLSIVLTLSGCGMTAAPPPERERRTEGNYLTGGYIDPEKGYQATVESTFSDRRITQAQTALEAAGIPTGEPERLRTAVSRAEFITLLVRTLNGEPEPLGLPGESRYASYVLAGYRMGLFASCADVLSFTPSGGFLTGDGGWPSMEEPISRYDAAALLAPLLPAEEGTVAFSDEKEIPASLRESVRRAAELFPPLPDGSFCGEGPVSWGHSLVCAQRLMQDHLPLPSPPTAQPLEALLSQEGRIVHAGGRVLKSDGRSSVSTNSAEAVLNAYRSGERVLEIDFNWTDDGELACIHDWGSRFSGQITQGQPLSLEEWKKVRLFGELTPLTLDSLACFLREHPEVYVVTDVKDGNVEAAQRIARTCPDLLERFVIQIYTDAEYESVAELGFSHIIFTLYSLSRAEKLDIRHWVEFAAAHPLTGYTYPVEYLEVEGYTQAMAETGLPLFVHTVNGQEDIRRCYAQGISAVYTDDIRDKAGN